MEVSIGKSKCIFQHGMFDDTGGYIHVYPSISQYYPIKSSQTKTMFNIIKPYETILNHSKPSFSYGFPKVFHRNHVFSPGKPRGTRLCSQPYCPRSQWLWLSQLHARGSQATFMSGMEHPPYTWMGYSNKCFMYIYIYIDTPILITCI